MDSFGSQALLLGALGRASVGVWDNFAGESGVAEQVQDLFRALFLHLAKFMWELCFMSCASLPRLVVASRRKDISSDHLSPLEQCQTSVGCGMMNRLSQ